MPTRITTTRRGSSRVCDAVHKAATSGTGLDGAIALVADVTNGNRALAAEALSTCARRSLQDADGWFQAARLLERALNSDGFDDSRAGPGNGQPDDTTSIGHDVDDVVRRAPDVELVAAGVDSPRRAIADPNSAKARSSSVNSTSTVAPGSARTLRNALSSFAGRATRASTGAT